jgi:hypothetical protein
MPGGASAGVVVSGALDGDGSAGPAFAAVVDLDCLNSDCLDFDWMDFDCDNLGCDLLSLDFFWGSDTGLLASACD